MSRPNKKDREIARAWNKFNTHFRVGFTAAERGDPNPGDPHGTPKERGLHAGWTWQKSGEPLPKDPMWVVISAERLFPGRSQR